MGRCCGRSSAGCCVPASVLLGRKQVLGNPASFWTAACGAVTRGAGAKKPGFLLAQESHCGPLTRPPWTAGHPLPPGERRFGPPCMSFPRKRESSCFFLDCCLRRKDTWGPPHPAVPSAPPASPAVGRGGLDCCLRRNDTGGRRKDTGTPSPGQPGRLATLSRMGRGGLGSCLRRNDTVAPSPGGALGTAGLSRGGERRGDYL